jgi:23S rRNA pseudouridine1911/1915/1917 synthase
MWRNWYTRMLQEHIRAILWRFESSHAHEIICPDGGIGIRASLRNWFPQGIGGSSPLLGTMKNIIIEKNNSNQRIDKFLVKEFFSYTRGEIVRNIKAGSVLVNNKKTKPSYILKKGDELEINLENKKTGVVSNKKIKFEIIYKDKDIIVINKPAGLQVHPGRKKETDTLVNGLISKFSEIKNVGDDPENRPGIVHRLDKDTSGVMIVARNQEVFFELKNKFKNREVSKKYLSVVHGKLENKTGIIEKPIARAGNYKKQVIAGGKTRTKIRSAVTEYRVVKEFGDYSLVEVVPKTGRTHQIRVHLTSIGHPIVGDKKYALKSISEIKAIRRQLLHAESIEFELKGKKYEFGAPPPKDFLDFLAGLTKAE